MASLSHDTRDMTAGERDLADRAVLYQLDAGADDDCLRTLRWNNNGRAYDGLPSPGMPGQVQWV